MGGGTDSGGARAISVGRVGAVKGALWEVTPQEGGCSGKEEQDEEDEEEGDDRAVGMAESVVDSTDAGPYASTSLRTCAATDMARRPLSMEQDPEF